MSNKIAVPRHRIPKLSALCPRCQRGTRVVSALAFAAGYHRRHICRDMACDYAFYTLTPYAHENGEQGTAQMSPLPFKDRPMTEEEVETRLAWWTEVAWKPAQVTLGGNPSFLQRMAHAIAKPEDQRTATDTYIVSVFNALETKVAAMDAAAQGEQ